MATLIDWLVITTAVIAGELFLATVAYFLLRGKITDWKIRTGLAGLRGDADALLFVPFDDGKAVLKPGYFQKKLVGGIGGYETEDGDKFVADGRGDTDYTVRGTPIALAVDPSEHASVVNAIKALVANRENLGEWVRVDHNGNPVQYGEALEPDGGIETPIDEPPFPEGMDMDPEMEAAVESAVEDKVYDLSPPTRVNEDGETVEADGFVVSQSEAADLLPKRWTSEALQIMQDKARMEEYDPERDRRMIMYGAGGATVICLLMGAFFWAFTNFM